jgi:hypothetical protein
LQRLREKNAGLVARWNESIAAERRKVAVLREAHSQIVAGLNTDARSVVIARAALAATEGGGT